MKEIKLSIKIGFLSFVICYLLRAFVVWDILWISKINEWSIGERGGLLALILTKITFDIVFAIAFIGNTKKTA